MKLCVCVLLQVLGEAFLALEGLDTVGKSANKPGGLFPARTRGRYASLEAALRGPLDPKAIRLTIEATVLVGMSATGQVRTLTQFFFGFLFEKTHRFAWRANQ